MNRFLEQLTHRPLVSVSVYGLILLLCGNWLLPLLDRDEPKFAEAAREMRQRRDFIVPYFNGGYRFDKPPLIYWCQAGCYAVLGENRFAARLPSVLFATATGCLLVLWGRRLGNERAGFHAGLIFLSCLQVLIHGRLALADMPMVFFVTAAAWAMWETSRPGVRISAFSWVTFIASLGLGFLAKGPVAWLPLGGLLTARLLRPKEFSLRAPQLMVSVVAAGALVAAWGLPALMATHGEFFRVGIGRHVVQRSFGVLEGHGLGGWLGYLASTPLYLATFFLSFFPWALSVPSALRSWWNRRASDAFGWYLLLQAALVFLVFSLVRTKLPHYTLPAFGCLSLWLSLQFTGEQAALRVAKASMAMAVLTMIITLAGFPLFARHVVTEGLWEKAKPEVEPGMKLTAVGFTEPSLVWQFRSVITNYAEFLKVDRIETSLRQPAPFCLVLPTAALRTNQTAVPSEAVLIHAVGVDTAGFKHHDLTAVIVRHQGNLTR